MTQEGHKPDVATYNSAMSGLARCGEWELAFNLLDKMQKGGVEANPLTYETFIMACWRGGEWRRARNMLKAMSDAGIPPRPIVASRVVTLLNGNQQYLLA